MLEYFDSFIVVEYNPNKAIKINDENVLYMWWEIREGGNRD